MSRIIIQKGNETFEQAVERTNKEHIKERIEYEKPRKMADKVCFDGIVKVIYDDKVITYYVDEYNDDYSMAFEDILKKLKVNYTGGIIWLCIERGLEGEIWQYNNYGDNLWYYHATTKGYA